MNLNAALAAVALPSPPPEPVKETPKPKDDQSAVRKREDFEHMIREEMERKKELADATPLPSNLMPWLPVQTNAVSDDDGDDIGAADALDAGTRAAARAFAAGLVAAPRPVGGGRPRSQDDVDPNDVALKPVAKTAPQDDRPKPIHVVVEPDLPVVQPVDKQAVESVPLVKFPQVVAGTATQMLKDGKPITQLEFEITPPHVGPVNLNVSLQDRVVSVQLIVPTIQAKQMLEGQTGAISSILQAQNLTPGQIRVVTATGGKNGAGAAGQQQGDQTGFGLMNGGRRRSNPNDDLTSTNL